MKPIFPLSILLLITIFASACSAAPAVPTINGVDVQNTAMAAALTLIAQTQAAIPTATPLPPTETSTATPAITNTPPATDTPLSLPTSEATFTAAVQTNVDPCANRILAASPRGRETIINIVNTVRTQVTVSLYLNETATWGECGYRSYILGSRDNVLITDLIQGCYNLWAFNSDSQNPVNASGYGCINNPDKWTFEITSDTIKFNGP
jgi:hypothetical protein